MSSKHQTTTDGVRVEEYARTVLAAEANTDGWQDAKTQDVMMTDAFNDEAIQEMAMSILSNSDNLSTSEIDPIPHYSSTRTRCTYRRPSPPPAFPFSRFEGWCLRNNLRTYRNRRFKLNLREKDPVDRLIHRHFEKAAKHRRPKSQLSLYQKKLGMILTAAKYFLDSFDLCKERAKALQHEPSKSSPLRECMSNEDDWEIADFIEDFFEQWFSRYEELYQPEDMSQEGLERYVSELFEQFMDWEGDVPSLVPPGQISMNGGNVGPSVPPVASETEYGNGGHLDAIMQDLITPNQAVPKSNTGWEL